MTTKELALETAKRLEDPEKWKSGGSVGEDGRRCAEQHAEAIQSSGGWKLCMAYRERFGRCLGIENDASGRDYVRKQLLDLATTL